MKIKEQKLSQIRNQLDTIIEGLEIQSEKGMKLHEVERHLFSSLLQLGLRLLGYYILLAQMLIHKQGVPVDSTGKKMKNKGKRVRPYRSVFGSLGIERSKYYSQQEKTFYRLDEFLGLPACPYSYLLSDWLSYGAVEMDFNQSVKQVERILGHKLSAMQSSRCTYHLSEAVEGFYAQKEWQHQEGTHLSVGYDGKGVPIKRCETERAAESTSARLGKGQNRDVKREATVSVSSSFTARKRSVDEVIKSLFSNGVMSSRQKSKPTQKAKEKHRWHENKHIRAFLSDKQRAIAYGIDNVLKRDSSKKKPIIVLIDGDRALEKAVRKTVEEKGVTHRVDAYILDFIHLLEYVWKVANAYWGEKHPARVAWVQQQAHLLLQSQWQQVLEQWQHMLGTQSMTPTQIYNIQRAITYVSNRPHMIDYKNYLDKGYPITTGAVESACGHFVKSRMERNAMHWGKEGAQKMLNIRAVKKNGDWDSYIENFIKKEQESLYKRAA